MSRHCEFCRSIFCNGFCPEYEEYVKTVMISEKAVIIKAPQNIFKKSLFLAGSITNAWNWQEYVSNKLTDLPIIILNPRREDFNVFDANMESQQIAWEFRHLQLADTILFWFSQETVAPISLFELGRFSMIAGKQLFVGVDPKYPRKRDVIIQLGLVNTSQKIHMDIDNLINEVRTYFNASVSNSVQNE